MATRRLQIIFAANTRGAMASIKGLGQGVSGLDGQLARLARRSRDLQGLGAAMVGAGLAIKGALTAATVAAARFNQEMADVSTVMDGAQISIDDYKKSVLALPSVLGDATGLAKGLYETLSADIPADKAIKFTADAAKLAKAGRATVAQSVDILSTIVNAYGMQAEDATRISDILFKTVEKGKTVVPELATSMGRVIPIAAQLGLSLEELSAAIATTTRGGLQTSESVTAIKSVLSDVLKPSARAKIVSQQLGIEFGVASLKAKGFAGFLQHIRERFQQLSDPADLARMKMELLGANLEKVRDKNGQVTKEGEKLVAMFQALEEGAPEEAMAALFDNVKGLNVVMGLTGQQADGFARDLEMLQNAGGSTEKAFQKNTNTLMSSWETMGNAFGKLMIRIGNMGDGPLTRFVQQLTSGIDAASKWIDENEQLAQQIFLAAGAVGTFLVVGGTLLTMLGGIAAALASVARGWKGFAPAAAVAGAKKVRGGQFFTNALEGGTVRNFSTLPAAASMGAALPGVAGLGAALGSGPVATLLQPQNALGIAATAGALPQLGKGLGLILAPLGQLLTRLPLLGPLFASLAGSTAAAGAAAVASGGLFARFAAALPLVGRGLLALVGGPIGAAILGITALGVAWSRNLGGIRDTATRWMAQMKPVLVGGWQRLVQWVAETWEELSYKARFWFYRVIEEIKPALREVQSFFEEIGPDVKRIWDASLAVLVPIAKFQMENLIETFRTAWATTRLVFALAWDLIKGVVVTAWNVITPLVKGQLALVSGIITAAMRLMKGDWFGAWDALEKGVTKALVGVWQAVTGGVTAILDTLRNFGADLRDLGGELMQSLLDGVMSQGERSVEMARQIGDGMARGLEEGFAPRPNVLGKKIMEALQAGGQGAASLWNQAGGWAANAMGAANQGLDTRIIQQYARGSAVGDLSKMTPENRAAAARMIQGILARGLKPIISSVTGGKHTDGSYHYSGQALDFGVVRPDGSLLPYAEELKIAWEEAAKAGYTRFIDELQGGSPHLHVSMGQNEGKPLQGPFPFGGGAGHGGSPQSSATDPDASKRALRERENALKWLEDLRTDAQTDILALADKQFDADRLKAKREAEARRRELKDAALNEQERAEAVRLINENLAAELRDIDKRQAEHKKKQDEEAIQQAKRAGEELAKAFADAESLDLTAGIDAATTKVQGIVEAERSRLDSLRQMVDESRKRVFEQQGNQRGAALLALDQELAQVRQAWKVHEQAQEQMELEHQARLGSIQRERAFAREALERETLLATGTLRGAALAERLFQIQQEYQAKTAALELEYQGEVANETRIMEAKLLLRQQWEVIEQDFRTRRQEAERLASSTTQQLWMSALEQIKTSFQQNLAQMLSGQISFGDFLKNTFQQILAAFANMVAQMVTEWLSGLMKMKKGAGGGVGGGIGSTILGVLGGFLGFHDGGLVPGTGRGDKVPALLEPGEFVLPRDVVDQARRFGARPTLRMQRGGMVPAVAGASAGGGVRVEFHHHGDVRSEADVHSIRRSVEEALSEALRRGGFR